MFSNKGNREKDTMVETPAVPLTQGKRLARTSAAPSIVSADLVITGTLVSSGDIQIDGQVDGDVRSAGLVIGEKAFVHGDIMCEEVTVRGRVEGSINARKVLLANTCHVQGNILHEAFAVETGAFFEGNCRHSENPLADSDKEIPVPSKPSSPVSYSHKPKEADPSAPTLVPPPLTGTDSATPLKS